MCALQLHISDIQVRRSVWPSVQLDILELPIIVNRYSCATRLVTIARLRTIPLRVRRVFRVWLEWIMQQQQWPVLAVLSPTIMPNSFKQSTVPQTWPLQISKISHTIQMSYWTQELFPHFTQVKSLISKPSHRTQWFFNSIRFLLINDCWSVLVSEANAVQTIRYQWHYLEPLHWLCLQTW
jgi:hypothetical protein